MTTPGDDEPLLPEQTSDDLPAGWGDEPADEDDLQRLLEDRPPHWDTDDGDRGG